MASEHRATNREGRPDAESLVRDAVELGLGRNDVESVQDVSSLVHRTFEVSLAGRSDDVIVMFCTDPEFESWFRVEPVVMEHVTDLQTAAVPDVLHRDFSRESIPYPFYVADRVEGYNPNYRFKYLPTAKKESILRDVGRALGHLHRTTEFEAFGRLEGDDELSVEPDESWRETLSNIVERQLAGVEEGQFADTVPRIRDVLSEHLTVVEPVSRPVLIHHDLRPANVILRNDELAAIIDWERSMAGHAEFDLFEVERNFLDIEFESEAIRETLRSSLFDGYESVRSLSSRWRTYRHLYRLIYLTETMWFYPRIPDEKYSATPGEVRAELDERISNLERRVGE